MGGIPHGRDPAPDGWLGRMESLLAGLADHYGPLLLALGALFAFAESALGLGFVFPGETVVLGIGAATTTGDQVAVAIGVVALGATAGDHLGYLIGHRAGPALRESRVVRRVGTRHWDRGTSMLRRYGVLAIVVSRLLPAVRTLVPPAAGASRLGYGKFLAGSVIGAILWSGLWVGVGAAARTALPQAAAALGTASWLVFGGIVVAAIVVAVTVHLVRRRSRPADRVAADEVTECA
ncbi:DedA family protein [Occultella aeris]|uniref:Inner membrane protein YabI n=2 Tax=Occultella aeris TaxID=2761496 RepID=A0A7M4DQ58_9MICO|nr:Inner membrane protein YabI [Occultella aeris]